MSITSFSKPSDTDIIEKIPGEEKVVSFIGEGSVLQSTNETIYIRTIKVESNEKEILRNVIYIKKGITWFFKKFEEVTVTS